MYTQDDSFVDTYISTIGVDFVSTPSLFVLTIYTALRLYSLFLDHQLTAIVSRNFINPLFVLANALLFRKSALSTSMERLSSYRL